MSRYRYVYKVYIKLAMMEWLCVDEGQREPYFLTRSHALRVQTRVVRTMDAAYMKLSVVKTIRLHRRASAYRMAIVRRQSCRTRWVDYNY